MSEAYFFFCHTFNKKENNFLKFYFLYRFEKAQNLNM